MNFDQFKKAINRFKEMQDAYKDVTADRTKIEQDAIQDSLVKRFEYTLENAWKSCKRYLKEEGFLEASTGSPKSIMRLAGEAGIIGNVENWIHYINARQSTYHDYSEQKAKEILAVADDFYKDAIELYQYMSNLKKVHCHLG
jgi:nucleotidyltransferase substrate binding protein (TIGR01987 family)